MLCYFEKEVSVFQEERSRKMTAIQKKKMYLVFGMMVMLVLSHFGTGIACVDGIETVCVSQQQVEKGTVLHGDNGESTCGIYISDTLFVRPTDVLSNGLTSVVRRLATQSDRFHINSVFAVLFKIAVIPDKAFIAAMTAEKGISDAGHRAVRYVHNSDGKKESSFFF